VDSLGFWVYAPSAETLRIRWRTLLAETDPATQSAMFKEGRDATLDKAKDPLPGADTHRGDSGSLRLDRVTQPRPVRGRLPVLRPAVGRARQPADGHAPPRPVGRPHPGQVFVIEQHSKPVSDGPGLIFSALIPDFDHFKGSGGGRTLPLSLSGRNPEPHTRPDPGTDR